MDTKIITAIANALKNWEKAEACKIHEFRITDLGLEICYTRNGDTELRYDRGSRFQFLAADISELCQAWHLCSIHINQTPSSLLIWTSDPSGKKDYSGTPLEAAFQ